MQGAHLAGDWFLWRDFAVRSAGFPVSGLEVFGPGDESARLRAVASDPLFCEAVTWQNPAALGNAVVKVADATSTTTSKARRREEIVASYWQRYCAKNDTIGFFGPLAWGRIEDDGLPLEARCGVLVREREVHLEAWAVQALAETIDPDLRIAAGPYAERDLRALLESHADSATRERGLAALERLEAARDAVAAAAPDAVADALAALDATFVELTRLQPVRNHGRYYGARTLSYVDCMRDLDVTIARSLLADIAPALEVLFEASRWYCGQIHAIGRALVERALPHDGRSPFIPVTTEIVRMLLAPPPEIAHEVAELERRLDAILADPDPATIGARAAAGFADHLPAWPLAVFESVDILIAARSEAAIAAGHFLVVIGDVHPGDNPLRQGLFAHRHPRPSELQRMLAADAGSLVPLLLPPWAPGMGVDARCASLVPESFIHVAAMPDSRAQGTRRTWLPAELMIDGGDVVDHAGELRVPLLDILGPVSLGVARTFELHTDEEHAPRVVIGRVVIRRESWSVLASEIPERAENLAAFARDRGMARRVFAKSPLEPKPIYVDTDSLVLGRILCRQARQAATDSTGARIRCTEMLPAPEDCWLTDTAGNRYVSEFRLVAVDHTRRGGTAAAARARGHPRRREESASGASANAGEVVRERARSGDRQVSSANGGHV